MRIERIEESDLAPDPLRQIEALLQTCFPHYPAERPYYNQLPQFRYLMWEKEELIGHLAVVFRILSNGDKVHRIFGVSDLCVAPGHQGKKIAGTLLEKLTAEGQAKRIPFLVLIAAEHDLYVRHGFQVVNNICRWLMIKNHQSFGISQRRIQDSLLVKPLGQEPWTDDPVDFLGFIF